MDRHRFLRVSMAAVLTASLMATPAWSCIRETFIVFLPGINGDGTLNFGSTAESDPNDVVNDGHVVSIIALLNTTTGNFCFKTCGFVENESGHCTFFPNENFFIIDGDTLLSGSPSSDVTIGPTYYCVSRPCHCISRVTYVGFATDPDL